VLDIPVPEVVLQRAAVVAIVGQFEPASMAQHVGMDWKRHLGGLAEPSHEVVEAHWADRPAALAHEDVRFRGVLPPQLAQGSDLIASDGMDAWRATLGSADVQPASIKLDLMPFQVAYLRSPQAVAIGDQDHGGIAMAMPIALGGLNQLPNLTLGKVATSNCEVFSVWCAGIASLSSHEKSLSIENDWKDNKLFLHSQQSGFE
jgi:hypothetical protein